MDGGSQSLLLRKYRPIRPRKGRPREKGYRPFSSTPTSLTQNRPMKFWIVTWTWRKEIRMPPGIFIATSFISSLLLLQPVSYKEIRPRFSRSSLFLSFSFIYSFILFSLQAYIHSLQIYREMHQDFEPREQRRCKG